MAFNNLCSRLKTRLPLKLPLRKVWKCENKSLKLDSNAAFEIVYKKTDECYIEWQRVTILAIFPFFRIRKEHTTMHPREGSVNVKEDLKEEQFN